ncbi:hypothetical protein EDD11_001299 [Mortierella claussenii]|nr:hypothetical protein EDD11_001299 [Mortierella claussenii]
MCGADGPETHATTTSSAGKQQQHLDFPKELHDQLTDAHCHIQDDRNNIFQLVQSWSALRVTKNSRSSNRNSNSNDSQHDVDDDDDDASTSTTPPLLTGKVCLMGVQPSKDLGRVDSNPEDGSSSSLADQTADLSLSLCSSTVRFSSTPFITVTWNDTDTKGDWDVVSKLAKDYPERFVPCFGIHPWFTHKYKSLEGSVGKNLVELRGVTAGQGTGTGVAGTRNGGDRSNTAAAANSSYGSPRGEGTNGSSPLLSFSPSQLTAVPGSGVDRETFLAMSKQLQEQMAKESREKGPAVDAQNSEAENKKGTGEGDAANPEEQAEQHRMKDHKYNNASASSTAMAAANREDGDDDGPQSIELSKPQPHDPRFAHYQKVLSLPNSAPDTYLMELAQRLPEPRALEPALKELRRQLEAHPHAVVGEIGLDRTARVPEPSTAVAATTTATATAAVSSSQLENSNEASSDEDKDKDKKEQKKTTLALTSIQHQLDIVREQLKLAASMDRAVSFHCVQAYGHWHDFLIQEGKRLKQMEADQGYQFQLQQIHESDGTVVISPVSPMGVRLSKKSAARLRREARDAAWERHVASTLQETSDEEEEEEDDENEEEESEQATPTFGEMGSSSTISAPIFETVLPPRLCMHSYGGSPDMLKAFCKMDHPPEMFFSFSILINGRLQERKLKELILAVPENRLLIESDHHSHTQVDYLLREMVFKVAEIRGWTVEETVHKTARNWHRFVYGA